ncbi:MAG: glycosyltransferase [Anaerolineales bacterium]|nr:glycosyltransferase [Anaerolineales bacterium]
MRKDKRVENIAYFFHASHENTLAYHRVVGPSRHLGLNVIRGFDEGKINVDCVTEGDVVVIQRDFPRFYQDYERIISLARKEKKPVVLDLDDLLFELPEDHPDRQSLAFSESLLPALQALMEVDLVTVATTTLKEYFQDYNRHITVLSNYLNDDLWTLREPINDLDPDRPVTIGYMGGDSHEPDLRLLEPILLELVERYPSKVQFAFWGIAPPAELIETADVIHVPMRIFNYPEFVANFQNASADIFVAPLVDNLFNSCKSAIKFLEYSTLGVPGVYSNSLPYSSVITNGDDGYLASTPNEWLDCLGKLIESPETRIEMASNAQKTIRRKWMLSKNAHLWQEAYQEALERKTPKRATKPFVETLKSITTQMEEFSTQQEQHVQALMEQVDVREQEVQALTTQVDEQDKQVQALTVRADEQEQKVQTLKEQVDRA